MNKFRAAEISKTAQRSLTLRVDTAQIRTAKFEGRDHVVVPVVALMEGVIQAVNADTPELVLLEELEQSFAGFNGRPVVGDHPDNGDVRISANDPRVLEREAFGTTFNAKIEDKKLKLEAWLDPVRVTKVGEKAERVLERVRNKEMVEVSVGVFVATEDRSGVHEGKSFKGIWRSIVPDHLAMLPEGTEGACSVEMGCGAPRAAQKEEEGMDKKKTPCEEAKESMWDRIKGLISFRSGQDDATFSDMDLRDALRAALQLVEPGFQGVEAVFPNESLVVYSVMPGEVWQLMRRSFLVSEEDEIELKDDTEEVRPVTRFETVKAAEGGKEQMDEKLKVRLDALIANERSPWTPCDLGILAQLPEERIASLEAACVVVPDTKSTSTEVVVPDVVVPPVEPVEDKLAGLEKNLGIPEKEITEIVKAAQAAQVEKKDALVSLLKAAQDIYTEDELKKMDMVNLEKLAKVAKTEIPIPESKDYSGQGVPRTAETVPNPPNLFDRIRTAAQGGK